MPGLALSGALGCRTEVPQLDQTQQLIFALEANNSSEIEALLRQNPRLCNVKTQNGRTPLLWAAVRGNQEVAELALGDGADPNARTDAGWTPLLETVGYRDVEMARLLLARGADVNAKTNDGKTALDVAKENDDQATIALLSEHGGIE